MYEPSTLWALAFDLVVKITIMIIQRKKTVIMNSKLLLACLAILAT